MNTAPRVAPSSSKGGAPDAARPLDTGAVTKRLQQELMGLMASGGDGVSAFPAGDSLFDWVGTINVSAGWCSPLRRSALRAGLGTAAARPFVQLAWFRRPSHPPALLGAVPSACSPALPLLTLAPTQTTTRCPPPPPSSASCPPTRTLFLPPLLCSQGAEGTPYEGCTFRLGLRFTGEYPFKPPAVRFDTPCFHPNVDTHGNICLDILKEKWSGESGGCGGGARTARSLWWHA